MYHAPKRKTGLLYFLHLLIYNDITKQMAQVESGNEISSLWMVFSVMPSHIFYHITKACCIMIPLY